jgi:hypothetical protein
MKKEIINKNKRSFFQMVSIFGAVFSLVSVNAHAESADVIYYSETVRQIDISAIQSMLLIFPESPFGVSCQGDTSKGKEEKLVEIKPPEDNSVYDQLAGAAALSSTTGSLYNGLPNKINSTQKDIAQDLMSKRLVLTPLKKSGVSTCTFELSNQDSFTVEFHLNKKVIRPAIEFKNLYQNVKKSSVIAQTIGGLNLFKILLSGNNISFFSDITPSHPFSYFWDTANAQYTVEYIGTDKTSYKAWRIQGKLKNNIPSFQLKPKGVGDLFYSAALKDDNFHQAESYKKGEEVNLYVLSRADFQNYEMEALLP